MRSQQETVLLRGLDLNLLVALNVLLQERHVTRAAARLCRSQPAVSAMLSRLRDYFGDELICRSGRDVELTPFGAALVQPVREFVQKAEGLMGMQRAASLFELERVFTIMMSDSVAEHLVLHLIEHLREAAPSVVIRVKTVDHGAAFGDLLERGETDFVIAPSEVLSSDSLPDLVVDGLYTEKQVCIGDRDRVRAADILDIEKFSQMPFVAVRFSDGSRLPLAELPFEQQGIRRNIKAYVPYFQLLPRLVENSDRIAIVHERTAVEAMTRFNIAIFEPPIAIPDLHLKLLSHSRHAANAPFVWIREAIRLSLP